MTSTRAIRLAYAGAAAAASMLAGTAQATASGPCARTPGSVYWEVCVQRDGCRVYVWSTMPPTICL